MHTVKETDMLATKLDLLLKRMDEREKSQELMLKPVQAVDSHLTCKVCENGGHSGSNWPETREDIAYMTNNNNEYRPQGGQGWNQSLPTLPGSRKMAMDEQFARFVEMIQKIHVNVPLLDVMHVPMYAWYIKDIINSKRPLPTTKVIKLMEECSAPILNRVLGKKKDLGCPMITCSIRTHHFDHTLCDLGASVSVMPKVIFDQLNVMHLSPTLMHLQLADSSVRYLAGIAKDIAVKTRDYFIHVDFVVLDMEKTKEKPLILWQPFLSTAKAHIDVEAGEIRFNINGKEEKFNFHPK
ncbi:uncharacterized protein LOC101770237 [Setaria italica]|uniref:uncharacterized protein LOC101770237 n=1 Tax=Setaria italica TaxID=4555 RepID=UPI0006475741|nr:uncharacterized protein LOC101770237 [Setaria italica]